MEIYTTSFLFGAGFDTELRMYQLLALEKRASEKMEQKEIYPSLHELLQWYQSISDLLESKQQFEQSLPSNVSEIDTLNAKIIRKTQIPATPALLNEMQEWALTARQKIQPLLAEFEQLKTELLTLIESAPVGVLPLYRDEGYLLITHGSDTDVFKYQRKKLFGAVNASREIHSDYFSTWEVSGQNTPQQIKLNLIRHHREIPNPATWSFVGHTDLPLNGTLLPLAKEKLDGMIDQ